MYDFSAKVLLASAKAAAEADKKKAKTAPKKRKYTMSDLPLNYRVAMMVGDAEVGTVSTDGNVYKFMQPVVIEQPGTIWYAVEKWSGGHWMLVHNASTITNAVDAARIDNRRRADA
jgi:hypothetical protein